METSRLPTLQLVHRAQDGDEPALAELIERHRGRLLRWARGRLPQGMRGRMETEDLVQDALARTLQRLAHLRPREGGAFQAYTRQAVLNAIRNHIARRREEALRTGRAEGLAAPGPSPLEEVLGAESVAAYEAALAELSDEEREGVVARLEYRCSWQEIADDLGRDSPDAARMMVKRALKKMCRRLDHVRD